LAARVSYDEGFDGNVSKEEILLALLQFAGA